MNMYNDLDLATTLKKLEKIVHLIQKGDCLYSIFLNEPKKQISQYTVY